MTNKEDGMFKTDDNLNLYFRGYKNKNTARWMIIVHGHGEHSGRYEKFAEILRDEGVSIASYDARGTGRSEGREVYVNTFEEYIQDLTTFVEFARNRWSIKERFVLFGHSLGGLAALHWALRHPETIQTLILSSPCLGLRIPAHLSILNKTLNCIAPFYVYKDPVYPPYLSHDLEEVERYKNDPYVKRKITVRLLDEMINYAAKIQKMQHMTLQCPFYVLMAGKEKVVNPAVTLKIYDRVSAPRKNLRCFEDFYHEIFNEQEQSRAFDALKESLQDSLKFAPE